MRIAALSALVLALTLVTLLEIYTGTLDAGEITVVAGLSLLLVFGVRSLWRKGRSKDV